MTEPTRPDPDRCTCSPQDVSTGHSIHCPEKARAERHRAWQATYGSRPHYDEGDAA